MIQLLALAPLQIGLVILNSVLARRKGRSPATYALLSLIPFAGLYFIFVLVALPDRDLEETIDKILVRLEGLNRVGQ